MARHALTACLTLTIAAARDIPSEVQDFYDSITKSDSHCSDPLANGFTSVYDGDDDFVYCGHNLNTSSSVLFIQGPRGSLSNMDICCDGIQGGPADDGRCESDPSNLPVTAFQWIVESYRAGNQTDLDANVHPYVVFGNTGEKDGWPTFDPERYGIEPLSVMTVLCGGKLVYGVWGDMNGDDGDAAMVGEASISLATACYGMEMNGNNGYYGKDVFYLAFPGKDAVPGPNGAKWAAKNYEEFEASISDLGDRLMKRLKSGSEENQDQDQDQDQSSHNEDEDKKDAESSGSRVFGSPLGLGMIRSLSRRIM